MPAAVQNGGSERGYQELFASLAARQIRLQSRWPGHQGRIFIHRRSYRERTHLPHGERFWLGLLRLGRGGDEVMAEADKRGLCLG